MNSRVPPPVQTPAGVSSRENLIGIGYLFLTALCWSFVAVTIKQLTARVDPYTISFFRVFLASLVFVVLFVRQGGDWRRLRWWAPWILLAAAGRAGNYLFYNAGIVYTPSAAATILAPVQQIGVIVLARLVIGESMRGKEWGVALSLAGLLLIWWNGQSWATLLAPDYLWGYSLLIIAGLCSAVHFSAQRLLSATASGLEILLPVFILATFITVPFAWDAGGFSRSYPLQTWVSLLLLGLVLTGGSFYFMGEGYKRCDATTGVVITNSGVLLTAVWSVLILHEYVSWVMVIGLILGIAGTLFTIIGDQRRFQ